MPRDDDTGPRVARGTRAAHLRPRDARAHPLDAQASAADSARSLKRGAPGRREVRQPGAARVPLTNARPLECKESTRVLDPNPNACAGNHRSSRGALSVHHIEPGAAGEPLTGPSAAPTSARSQKGDTPRSAPPRSRRASGSAHSEPRRFEGVKRPRSRIRVQASGFRGGPGRAPASACVSGRLS
jgi:hypothetical protein